MFQNSALRIQFVTCLFKIWNHRQVLLLSPALNKGFYIVCVCIQLLPMPTAGLKLWIYFALFICTLVSGSYKQQSADQKTLYSYKIIQTSLTEKMKLNNCTPYWLNHISTSSPSLFSLFRRLQGEVIQVTFFFSGSLAP